MTDNPMNEAFEEEVRCVHQKLQRAMKRKSGCRLSADEVSLLALTQLCEEETDGFHDLRNPPC